MNPALAQRQLALAGVALLAIVAAVVLVQHARDEPSAASGPPPAATEWNRALAGPYTLPAGTKLTACGQKASESILGVAHPVLPCGAKVFLSFNGQQVLTAVIDHRMSSSGRQFDLTPALATKLGVEGTQELRWRFAVRR
jgi:hypothetical protein